MRVLTFAGRQQNSLCRIELSGNNSVLGIFNKKAEIPPPGVEVEIMLCDVLMRRETQQLFAILCEPVTSDHVLVQHEGFHCVGPMEQTVAILDDDSQRKLDGVLRQNNHVGNWITPGRTPVKLGVKGQAYMSIADMTAPLQYVDAEAKLRKHNPRRIAGVPDVSQMGPILEEFMQDDGDRRSA